MVWLVPVLEVPGIAGTAPGAVGVGAVGILALGGREFGILAEGAVFTGAFAEGAVFTGALAEGAVLIGAFAEGAVLTGAFAEGAVFAGAFADGAVFAGALALGCVPGIVDVGATVRAPAAALVLAVPAPGLAAAPPAAAPAACAANGAKASANPITYNRAKRGEKISQCVFMLKEVHSTCHPPRRRLTSQERGFPIAPKRNLPNVKSDCPQSAGYETEFLCADSMHLKGLMCCFF